MDSIGESIMEGSIDQSMPSHSASKLSASKRSKGSKRSKKESMKSVKEESDSLDRDEEVNDNLRR
jgi:hypothetical protein